MIDLIHEASESLLQIIGDILDTAKIEAGKLVLDSSPVCVETLVERVGHLLRPTAASRGVHLDVFVDPAIDRVVQADEIRLRQVLFNLVGNAIKFSSDAGRPGQVSVQARLLQRLSSGLQIELEVADNGIGLDEAATRELFTPFTQADASTTRRFGGSGLGLSICKRLLDLMGGSIRVASVPGQGSTFTVGVTLAVDGSNPAPPDAWRLDDVSCLLVTSGSSLAAKLTAYLEAAGAKLRRCPDLQAASLGRADEEATVWLVLSDPSELALVQALQPARERRTGMLRIGSGRLPTTTLDAGPCIELDAERLDRRALLRAVRSVLSAVTRSATSDDGYTPATTAVATSVVQPPLAVRAILVAEDNPLSRAVIERQIGLLGMRADVVEDGEQALALWRLHRHALVLTDVHMPAMDGHALATAIRAEEAAGQHTSIVALSANTALDEEGRCLAAGMDAFLTKPIRLPQLRAMFERQLGN